MENKFLSPEKYPEADLSSLDKSKLAASPFAHKDLKKSLEKVLSDSNKSPTLLENLLSDKARTLKASVNTLLEEIKLREDLNAEENSGIPGTVYILIDNRTNFQYIGPVWIE